MTVYVNDMEVTLLPGMTVRHAITAAGLISKIRQAKVRDAWGNEIGLDGALSDGERIFVETGKGRPKPGGIS